MTSKPPPNNASIVIQELTSDQISACCKILEEGLREALPKSAQPIGLSDFERFTEEETILVATTEDSVVGFVSVYIEDNFIHHLYVEKSCRGRGIGKALLEAGVALCNVGKPSLKCATTNLSAIEFYQRLGWKEVERGFDKEQEWIRFGLKVDGKPSSESGLQT